MVFRNRSTHIKKRTKMTYYSSSPSTRPKSLMELLLHRKIELQAAKNKNESGDGSADGSTGSGATCPNRLFRCDSMDSVSSIGSFSSLALGDDVCRCDDCLLGIVDLYITGPKETALLKKKVNFIHRNNVHIVNESNSNRNGSPKLRFDSSIKYQLRTFGSIFQ